VRDAWDEIMLADAFTVDDDADGTLLYGPVLSEGQAVFYGAKDTETAFEAAADVIELRVTIDGEPVQRELNANRLKTQERAGPRGAALFR
jgi:hypothetical protein